MSKNIWEEFDAAVDTQGLIEDAKAAAEGNSTFEEVPHGTYEVKVEKLELGKSKKDQPMVKAWFKVLEGPHKGSLIFYNQVISTGFGLYSANELLKSLESEVEIKFESFKQYYELLMDVREAIDGKVEYVLEYGKNDKGFNTYKITDVFEV